MQVEDTLDQREAETHAASMARPARLIRAVETIEHVVEVLGGDAAPAVDDLDRCGRVSRSRPQGDRPAWRGVRQRVGEQIGTAR